MGSAPEHQHAPWREDRQRRRARRRGIAALIAFALLSVITACGSAAVGHTDRQASATGPPDGAAPERAPRTPGFADAPRARSQRSLERAGKLAARAERKDEQPNFLHILTDDQTIDSIRRMPRLRRTLIRKGTTFSQYHAVQPLCCPSRATFISGQYPHNHRVLSNKPPDGGYGAMRFDRTLYTALDGAGYRTGWIGKVLNVSPGTKQGLRPEPGFDDWLVSLNQPKEGMREYKLSDRGRFERTTTGPFQNDLFADRASRFIRGGSGTGPEQPFLLTLAVFTPHWSACPDDVQAKGRRACPPIPDDRDRKRFVDARFPAGPNFEPGEDAHFVERYWRRELQAVQSVDRILARLVKQLRAAGELDDTYVIFQSDNGYLHGEHGLFGKNYPWDRSVRVPLVIRGPGFAAGENRRDLTANVDVPATILDAAHVRPQRPLDGYSLLSRHQRHSLLMERLEGVAKHGREPWREIKTRSGYTYWRYGESGHERLYDLNRDPYQTRNLMREKPGLAKRLRRQLERARDCRDNCP